MTGEEVHITGFNSQPSYGVKKGSIINMDSTVDSIKRAMKSMPDVYIDRWTSHTEGGKYVPVYVKVPVPEDCPPP